MSKMTIFSLISSTALIERIPLPKSTLMAEPTFVVAPPSDFCFPFPFVATVAIPATSMSLRPSRWPRLLPEEGNDLLSLSQCVVHGCGTSSRHHQMQCRFSLQAVCASDFDNAHYASRSRREPKAEGTPPSCRSKMPRRDKLGASLGFSYQTGLAQSVETMARRIHGQHGCYSGPAWRT